MSLDKSLHFIISQAVESCSSSFDCQTDFFRAMINPRYLFYFKKQHGLSEMLSLLNELKLSSDSSKFLALLVFIQVCSENKFFCLDFLNNGGFQVLQHIKKNSFHTEFSLELIDQIEILIQMSKLFNKINNLSIPTIQTFIFKDYNFSNQSPSLAVYIQPVAKSMQSQGQQSVGYILWSSSIILSKWLFLRNHLIINKSVCEIGAGLGLCSIVCGQYARAVTITDYSEEVIQSTKYNIQLNQGAPTIDDCDAAISAACDVQVQHLDWHSLPLPSEPFSFSYPSSPCFGLDGLKRSLRGGDNSGNITHRILYNSSNARSSSIKYDLLLGADVVCTEDDAIGVMKAIYNLLAVNGIAVLLLPQQQHRYGSESLLPLLHYAGLDAFARTIIHSKCLNQHDREGHFQQLLRYLPAAPQWCLHIDSLFHPPNRAVGQQLDDLLCECEEDEFTAWDLVLVRWPQTLPPASPSPPYSPSPIPFNIPLQTHPL